MIIYILPAYWQFWPVLEWGYGYKRYLYQIRLGPVVIRLEEPKRNAPPVVPIVHHPQEPAK